MSRLTGSDALGLYEAYQAVYTPQINEEQVWEEVESWVNSLLEEGYDLSEYTWEEMYEEYITEIGAPGSALDYLSRGGQSAPGTVAVARRQPNGGIVQGTAYKSSSDGKMYKNYNDAKAANNSRLAVQKGFDNTYRAGGGNAAVAGSPSRPAQSPLAVMAQGATNLQRQQKPATARPAAGAPARPAASSPAPKPAAATTPTAPKPATGMLGKTSFERRTPTSAELKAAQASRAGGEKNPEKVLQAAKAASTPKPAAGNTLSQTTAAASKPAAFSPTPAATPAAKPPLKKPIAAGFDMFDVVKGYLIGEGYADTEEAALAIMINMSEEWRQSIVEERAPGVRPYEPRKRRPLDPEKPLSGEMGDGSGYGADEKFKKPDDKIKKPGTEVPAPKKGGYGRILSNIPYGIGAHANRQRSRNSTVRGMDPGAPRSEKLAPTEKKEKKKPSKEIVRKRRDTNESYNIILSYLLDEGYANTVESAEAIISNMSEDWILSIIQ